MGRDFLIVITRDKTIAFKLPQLLCQTGLCNISDMPAEFTKAMNILKRYIIENFDFPFAA